MRSHVIVFLASLLGCYDADKGPGETPDAGGTSDGSRYRDSDEDGVPDAFAPDPDIEENDTGDPDDNDNDGWADGVDLDDDNDDILDDAPDPSLVSALRPVARAECEAVAACCQTWWSEAAISNCTLWNTGLLVVSLAQSWAEGLFSLDQAGQPDCVAAQALDCDSADPLDAPHGCGTYLIGHQDERRLCYQSVDCSQGFACAGRGPEGPDIGPGPYQVSAPPRGQASEGQCLERIQLGDSCAGPEEYVGSCAEGLECFGDEPTCRRRAGDGEACTIEGEINRFDDCERHLFCDLVGDALFCRERLAVGASCAENRECSSNSCDLRQAVCVDFPPPIDFCGEGEAYEN